MSVQRPRPMHTPHVPGDGLAHADGRRKDDNPLPDEQPTDEAVDDVAEQDAAAAAVTLDSDSAGRSLLVPEPDQREVEEAWDRLSAVMQWLVVRKLQRRSRAGMGSRDS